jgi:hypothetical protein
MAVVKGAEISRAADQADTLAAAHADLLTDRSLQFEMSQIAPPEIPLWLRALAEFLSSLGPFLVYVFWIGVAAIVILILYLIISEIVRRLPDRANGDNSETKKQPEYRPTAARARVLLEEADRLAAEGRFDEAARVLLHYSIEDMQTALSFAIAPGLTSREIARIEPLSAEGRSVFTRIAQAVEMSLFAGRPLDSDGFKRCREAYASFALSGGLR